jgi:hypothetical protein
VQGHGLLGDCGAQPLDLGPGRLQLGLLGALARPAGHRRGQRVDAALRIVLDV